MLRASNAPELEAEVNRFLEELDEEHEAQLEDISQSEGPYGITITIWYTLLEELEALDEATADEEFVRVIESSQPGSRSGPRSEDDREEDRP